MHITQIDDEILAPLLRGVEKPARYVGGELGSVVKDPASVSQRFCLCFPDNYEVGMSHLGSRILYGLVNERPETQCERCFAPWPDMEAALRNAQIPLYSLESRCPLAAFDIVGFTLQYEMSYTNLLNMLDLAGLPLRGADRTGDMPFIACGGPCAVNPEPLAPFVDLFLIGDGEESLPELLDCHTHWKSSGADRAAFLRAAAQIEGCYVPSLYDETRDASGVSAALTPQDNTPPKVARRIVDDFEHAYFPTAPVVPYVAAVHDRVMLEIFRGCTRGCRFCQAGFLYRPVRERSVETLTAQARASMQHSGYEELSLTSLSSGDYPHLGTLIDALADECAAHRVSLQLPSLRIDSFAKDTAEKLSTGRKGSLTFAPEAGSQRLRDAINKGVTEDDLIRSVSDAFHSGWNSVKLYFMIGLPTETDEDLDGIVDLAKKVAGAYFAVPKDKRNKGLRISVSASSFVPKPATPFQWEAQCDREELRRKQRYLKDRFKGMRGIEFHYHDPETSFLEAVFAKGGRALADVLENAWRLGCKFDAWSEHFSFERWMAAFEACGVDPEAIAYAPRARDFHWPFEHIDTRVDPDYLWKERERALAATTTRDCRKGCNACFDRTSLLNHCAAHASPRENDPCA